MVLSYLLYEGLFRTFMSPFPGGLFLGMLITTLIVFSWNYLWNKSWSLGVRSQLLMMKRTELEEIQLITEFLLKEKFDFKGERI